MDSDFKCFRRSNKLTQDEIATFLGCTQGFVSQVEKGISALSPDFIRKILANTNWDTSMFTREIEMQKVSSPTSATPTKEDRLLAIIESQQRTIEELSKKIK